ncbi:MAG TPA: BamA/TamA family outer membrane protein [Isosphaeraceae bacterium]|nr:BamA/TamA family outer membrane protein [Isosphaeraceae bacterium]
MTRGVLDTPPGPGMVRAGRAAGRAGAPGKALAAVARPLALMMVLAAVSGGPFARRAPAREDEFPRGMITEVRIEGNVTITTEQVRAKLLSKPNTPLDQGKIDADLKSLLGTKWFSNVRPFYSADPNGKGYILTFRVKEMPILTDVEFRGRKKVKLSEIEEATGLKKGARADAARTRMAVGQIQRLYAEKGYDLADVRLVEGGERGDTRVVIQIFEGPKLQVGGIGFEGNMFSSDATLRTKIVSRKRILGLFGGRYHREDLEEDARKLREYYQGQGFYEVKVSPVTRTGSSLGDVRLTFVISEGIRYKVRNISFEGNKKISEAKLREGLLMHSGQPILDSIKEADRKSLIAKYNGIGCIDTQILPDPRITDQPGVVDLVYRIEEGNPYLLGELRIYGNERTRDKVIRREAAMAGIRPGEVLNLNRLEMFKARLANLGYFVASPEQGKPIDIRIANRRPGDKPFGDIPLTDQGDVTLTRMQGPDPDPPGGVVVPPMGAGGAGAGARGGAGAASPPGPPMLSPFGGSGVFSPPADTLPPIQVPTAPVARPPIPPAPPGPGGAPATPPLGAGEPPGEFPSAPGLNMTDVGPDRQDPFPNRAWADIITSVEEAPTGRFMLGVGASGWQGLNGTLSVYEKNFDILNIPRSFDDITSGKAFRGGGQDFQLSLMAGTLINRFQVSLREPYLFDLPIGASGSGYLFQRIYPNWTESRAGGRFALGRQFGPATYADVAFRVENVEFYGFNFPAPAEYLAASGHSLLASIRPTLRFDNRNAPFMPNKGQYLEFAFEQGWGTFTYPKIEVEGRKYFTLGTRPDGSGPRILILRGHFGATGRDTPVYERFFAGYLGSLRGFQYRGVGPHVDGVNVGGFLQALGSVEYMFPLTASDSVRQVVFCDFGTIENTYEIRNFRASVGTGLRITIPQFGPLPLCFDLAFPVAKAPGDKINYFNFSIGAFY